MNSSITATLKKWREVKRREWWIDKMGNCAGGPDGKLFLEDFGHLPLIHVTEASDREQRLIEALMLATEALEKIECYVGDYAQELAETATTEIAKTLEENHDQTNR
jgi:hypothetical protein